MPFDASAIHRLLDEAATVYHQQRGDLAPDRGDQFDAHLQTVRMVVDHTEHHIVNVVEA